MKFKTTALAFALAGVAAAGTAQASVLSDSASAFSYDSVGVKYTEAELDKSGGETDGFAVDGSLSVAPNFFITGELALIEDEVDSEATRVHLGGGYHRDLGLSIPTDFVAEVGVTAYDVETASGSESRDFAWDATVGARTSLGIQGLDATAYLGMAEKHDEVGDHEFGFKYGVAADYFVTSEVSVGIDYEVQSDAAWYGSEEEDLETVSFGAKYHF